MYKIGAILIFFLSVSFVSTQDNYKKEIEKWQAEMNASFADKEHSPLKETDREAFIGLEYYPISKVFRIEADFEHIRKADTILFRTTTSRTPKYFAYGVATFQFNGMTHQLTIYKSVRLMKMEAYKDYLFLPYTDASNGNGSYGGGRYLDPEMPGNGKIILDFNKSYNPYCAYNKKYSCPIPPSQNDLSFEVKAGVMDYKK